MRPSTNTGGSGLQFVWVCNLEFKAPTQDPCVRLKLTIKIKFLIRTIKLGHNLSFPETPKIPQHMCLFFLLLHGRKICDSVEVQVLN